MCYFYYDTRMLLLENNRDNILDEYENLIWKHLIWISVTKMSKRILPSYLAILECM